MSERARLIGRVVATSDPAPGSQVVTVEGREISAWRAGWLDVDVEGRKIRVDLEGTTCHGPAKTVLGTWRDLQAAVALQADLVPPFKTVKVSWVSPDVGDLVAVDAIVTSRGQPEVDYREAPPSTITRVRARHLARGDNAEAVLARVVRDMYPAAKRPTKRDPRRLDPGNPMNRPPITDFIPAVLAAAIGIAVAFAFHPAIVVGLSLIAVAFIVRPARFVRTFRTRDEARRETFTFGLDMAGWFYLSLLFGAFFVGPRGITYISIGWFAIVLVLSMVVVARLTPYRRIARATLWNGELGDERMICGIVRDPTPVEVRGTPAALGREERYGQGFGSDPGKLIATDLHNAGTFFVDDARGVVEIDPDETIWTSTVVEHPGEDVIEVIPIGGKVAAVGTISGTPPRLTSKGAQPAIVLATSEHGDPRGLARAIVIHHLITLAAIAILGATSMLITVRG